MRLDSLLVGLALFLAGHAVLAALGPRRPRSHVERHATAALLGLGVPAALYLAAVIAFGPLPRVLVLGALALLALAGAVALVRAAPPRERFPDEARAGASLRALRLLVLLFAAFAAFYAATSPVRAFDATFHFAHKGQLLATEGFATEGWTDLDGRLGRVHTHPGYPPGLPALEALASSGRAAFEADAARALFALFALAPAGLLWAVLRSRGAYAAAAGAALWLTLPFLYYSGLGHPNEAFAAAGLFLGPELAGEAFEALHAGERLPQGYFQWNLPGSYLLDAGADVPLAAFVLGAFCFGWRLLPRAGLAADGADARAFALCAAGAVLAKNEGLALVALLVLALLLVALADRAHLRVPWSALGSAALLFVLLTGPWLLARRAIPAIDEAYPARVAGLARDPEAFARVPQILAGYARCLLPWGSTALFRWALVWPVFLLALAWRLARPRELARDPALPAVLFVALALGLYGLILVVTPWDLDRLFETLIPDRLVLHVTPVAVLGAGLLLWRRAPA